MLKGIKSFFDSILTSDNQSSAKKPMSTKNSGEQIYILKKAQFRDIYDSGFQKLNKADKEFYLAKLGLVDRIKFENPYASKAQLEFFVTRARNPNLSDEEVYKLISEERKREAKYRENSNKAIESAKNNKDDTPAWYDKKKPEIVQSQNNDSGVKKTKDYDPWFFRQDVKLPSQNNEAIDQLIASNKKAVEPFSVSFTTVGSTHTLCEDCSFSMSTDDGKKHIAAVSDGCSGSDGMTHIGSMLICAAIEKSFKNNDTSIKSVIGNMYSYYLNYNKVFTDSSFLLSESSLLATAVYVVLDESEERIQINFIGDGFVMLRNRRTKQWIIYAADYNSNAPVYPSYLMDKQKREIYVASFGQPVLNKTVYSLDTETKKLRELSRSSVVGFSPYTLHKIKNNFDMIMVFSDGIDSFYDESTNKKVSFDKIFLELVSFPGQITKTSFNRRFNKFQRSNPNIKNRDDFSCSIIKY